MSNELRALEQAAVAAAEDAYAKYSNFRVGAAVLLSNGEIVSGSNQENSAYPSGICAERTALFYAGAKYPNEAVEKLLIVAFSPHGRVRVASPCGACRQVMLETSVRFHPYPVYLAGPEEVICIEDNRDALPFPFDGSDL
ncbi:cytidine deaminase [Porphyromonas crevioricanis]|nr:cytidine deaminase [Porphyromonas crevioricanis]